jgi:hypothetical protein
MTEIELLTAANPLTDEAASRLPIDAAEREMLDALVARSVVAPVVPAPWARRRLRRGRAVIGTLAVAVPVIAVIVLLPTARRGGHAPRPAPAPAPAHARKAPPSTSPRVLFARPGWHVWDVQEDDPLNGELDFAPNGARITNGAPAGGGAQLHWYPASAARGYRQDRANEASIKLTMRVLGARAQVIQYKGTPAGRHQYSAIFTLGPRSLEFRSTERDMAAFKADLAQLRVVENATWLKALPASIVQSDRRTTVIRQMLKGIPLPPGFSVDRIPGANLVADHYQLGAAVTGVVACQWFARWGHARQAGNQAAVNRAVAAMSTAARWPILRTMSTQGGWTQVLVGYAKAMPSGRWFKRPLLGDVDSGLGCSSEWHIKLGTVTTPGGLQPVRSSP